MRMIFNNPYFSIKDKLELLQRWILVHSYLYYIMDYSLVSDYDFDMNCQQLAGMKQDEKHSYRKTRYYYAMRDFDGSTGNGYFERLNEKDKDSILRDAKFIMNRRW